MNAVDKALEAQLKNLQTRAGKDLDELFAVIRSSGLAKHGEIRDLLKRDLAMGHGDANTLARHYLEATTSDPAADTKPTADTAVDTIYSGPKAELRPIHDLLMAAVSELGPFEIAPKKAYLSLRRKKQFAMIGPATKSRVDVGLNMKGVEPTARLSAMPPGGMCQYSVKITKQSEVDAELIEWIRQAYESAG